MADERPDDVPAGGGPDDQLDDDDLTDVNAGFQGGGPHGPQPTAPDSTIM